MKILLLLIVFLFSIPLNSQSLPPEVAREFNQQINSAVNGITLFNSDLALSSGRYSFDDGSDFELVKIPYTYKFNPIRNGIIPEMYGLLSSSKITSTSDLESSATGRGDFDRVSTNSIEIGAGAAIPFSSSFHIIPRFSAAYSHLKRKYDFNNSFSQEYLVPFNRDIFNTSVDIMTYTPSVEIQYATDCDDNNFIVHSKYSQLFNDSFASKSSVIDINSNSGVLQTGLQYIKKFDNKFLSEQIIFSPYVVQTNVFAEAKDALDVAYFHEIGTNFTFTNPKDSLLSAYTLGGSYTIGDNFDGYRLSFGFSL